MALFRRQSRNQQNAAWGQDVRGVLMSTPPDRIRPQLRLMISRPGPHLGALGMAWPIGGRGDIVAVACVKGPDGSAVTVEAPMVQHWGMAAEDLWLQAATNLRHEGYGGQPMQTQDGSTLHTLLGQGWPGSAQLFRLGEAIGDPLPNGALVSLPTDNCVMALPITTTRTLGMVSFILGVAQSLTRDQQPLSSGMYWWHEGILEELEVRIESPERAQVSGSARFGRVMQALPR
ncbi:hypothetical protein [Streptomyces sp. SID3343]|uniref:hypothetical protein n=1 Tax=Streptomyces sp. SID3343 TaxID=2690260 RepID=UPI001367A913|nr:hypothetical protein [Streptomyces sp. SID3343]MYV99990.1 hypothetical protein [Streptomyces sp. SID3343]